MKPNEQGRHCMSCQKTVVDFTSMSDKEILAHISKATSSVCGRLDNHQLNRELVDQVIKKKFSFAYVWNVIVATFLITGTAKAQGQISLKKLGKVEKTCSPKIKGEVIVLGGLI